jgi:hypothetical protein
MVNVPKSFQDYDDDDEKIEFRKNRVKLWVALKEISDNHTPKLEGERLVSHMIEHYGIKLIRFGIFFTDEYEIVDEEKYTLFRLKYY